MATYSGSPRTWATGETLTAALMNSDVRDPLAALAGAWTSYTPQVDQGASANISKTVSYAKYIRVGKLVIVRVRLAMTGTGSAGSAISITLPVTSAYGDGVAGSGMYLDTGSATYTGAVVLPATTYVWIQNGGSSGVVGASPSLAVANGDTIAFEATYEAA